jgi:ABC-type Fe3+/spermidine/putrescine transport system ATPase subunit
VLTIKQITRAYVGKPVLRGVNLDVAQGEIVCLLGPSGCGKTTLLRIVAGLEYADGGDVLLNGQSILTQPVHTRDFGLMFQDFALFPHLNVLQNVEFGLRMKHADKAAQQTRAREMLELVGLSGFEKRDVAQLSGGERQRVALARSLAPNPRLLMLDEPLGSLDAALKERLLSDLREIIKRVGLTALYVTHDQHEAFAIADRIALMNAGQFEQVGAPAAVYQRPKTAFAARFLGLNNIVPSGTFGIRGTGDELLLHPDGISLDETGTITGTVRESLFLGDAYRVTIQTAMGLPLTFKVAARERQVQAGDTVRVRVTDEFVVGLEQ